MKNEFPIFGSIAKMTLAALAILALFVYLPSFVARFGMLNDYDFMAFRTSENWPWFPETEHLFAIGRPVGALLLDFQGLFLDSLQNFAYVRLFSLLLTLVSAWLIYRYLVGRLGFDPVVAGAVAFCMVMLPPTQFYILSLTNFVPGTLTVFCSLLGYLILEKVEPRDFCRGNKSAILRALAALSVFFFMLCTYPPTALTFLALTFAQVLFSPQAEWPQVRLKVLRDLMFAGAGMVLYLLIFRFVMLPFFFAHGTDLYRSIVTNINVNGQYRFELTSNIKEKLGVFVYLSSLAFGGTMHAIFGLPAAWIMGAVTLALFGFAGYRARKLFGAGMNWTRIWQRTGVGFVIILCASCPSLAAEKGQTGYRVVSTYEIICLLCLIAPLYWLWRMRPDFPVRRFAVGLVLITGVLAGWNISNVARHASLELLFLEQRLETADPNNLTAIMGIYRHPDGNYLEWPPLLEFTCRISHVPDFAGAVKALLPETPLGDRALSYGFEDATRNMFVPAKTEYGKHLPPLQILYPYQALMVSDEQTLIVNFNDLVVSGHRVPVDLPSVRTSNGYGGRLLVDVTVPVYWEPGPAPQWMEITVPSFVSISQITFSAGPDPAGAAAMPKDWNFMISQNGVDWTTLFQVKDQVNWKINEERTIKFPKEQTSKYYMIVFTSANAPNMRLYKIHF